MVKTAVRKHPYERAMEHAHAMGPRMDKLAKSGFFNKNFKPYAKRCWDEAIAEATEEEVGESWTRDQRADRRLEIYKRKMEEAENAGASE